MTTTHVLRIPRTDEEQGFILVQVTSAGSRDLDIKLVATEGFAPYMVKLRHDRISRLKVENSPCSQDEWEQFLVSILLDRESVPDIEAAAHVVEEDSITITIRRRVQGITQRLGSLSLKHDEAQDIQLFEWCSASIAAREKVKADLASTASRARELESAVTELKDQLEELIQAKQSDESALLEKFRDLLNEKKVKIREQQRLLSSAGAGVGAAPARAASTQAVSDAEEDGGGSSHVPKPSRPSKRKAAQAAEPGDESDDALDKMEVDKKHGEEDSEDEQTTDADETGSEPDDDDAEPLPDRRRNAPSRKKPSPEPAKTRAAPTRRGGRSKQGEPPEAPPPKRSLPFGLGKSATAKKNTAQDEESETDDDEL
ncbi:hypothetical protein QBC33DRAFT_12733 [Phialemonium atrogriseum]|uniref:Mitotic apparatus protein p62 n=1 Tax=Phialemonium atrogriseum TaxID=1093897 RepID=A0AAJ0FLC7_9PEZI|nr:uncharacterized protein QBC33DRAFT_12733 [Phialemonium atrogriseum]KAK1772496.1 hypothetical protein QBC33DRAFT_12733 [Phialemonium atrogriseum]